MSTRSFAKPIAITTLAFVIAACGGGGRRRSDCADHYDDAQTLDAMILVQNIAQAWDARRAPDLRPRDIDGALTVIRCDATPRGRSRHMRAVAKLLGHDWGGERSKDLLAQLGFDGAAVDSLKAKVGGTVPPVAIPVYGIDPRWLEYATLRYLAANGEIPPVHGGHAWWWPLSPNTAVAQQPTCWQPEAPFDNQLVSGPTPFVQLTGHVSVTTAADVASKYVDPQKWQTCGKFWNPPSPKPPQTTVVVQQTWGDCHTTHAAPPFLPLASAPSPGTDYDKQILYEQFFVSLPAGIGNAHFENLLAIWNASIDHQTVNGSSVMARHVGFHLGSCGNDKVDGGISGAIGGRTMTVVLDSGYIDVWSEGGRTHVAALKRAQFSDDPTNWLTQLNPALNDLNEQLGELACCLP